METFDEFWLFYLRAHAKPLTRGIHYIGISAMATGLLAAAVLFDVWIALGAVALGYIIAWTAHFTVEGNKPVMHQHPLRSLRSGLRMYLLWITGRLKPELKRAGVT